MTVVVQVVFETPQYDAAMRHECPEGLPIGMVFRNILDHFWLALRTEGIPAPSAFRVMSIEPSHIDGVPITHVWTPCIICARAVCR